MATQVQENIDLARKLRDETEAWFNRNFNYISLGLVEGYLSSQNQSLYEFIEPAETDFEDFVNCYLSEDFPALVGMYNMSCDDDLFIRPETAFMDEDFAEWLKEEYSIEWESYEDELRDENYPMWNTLFEWKSNPGSDWIQHAKDVGLGVINDTGCTNKMLFASSAGHSFYSAYWIPLYLKCCSGLADQYKGVDYSMM